MPAAHGAFYGASTSSQGPGCLRGVWLHWQQGTELAHAEAQRSRSWGKALVPAPREGCWGRGSPGHSSAPHLLCRAVHVSVPFPSQVWVLQPRPALHPHPTGGRKTSASGKGLCPSGQLRVPRGHGVCGAYGETGAHGRWGGLDLSASTPSAGSSCTEQSLSRCPTNARPADAQGRVLQTQTVNFRDPARHLDASPSRRTTGRPLLLCRYQRVPRPRAHR